MKSKPRILSWIAAFLVGVAAAMPIQIMFLYGHAPAELQPIAAKLTPLNWSIMFAAPLVAWLVWRASPYALLAVPMLCALVIQNNWVVAELSEDYSPTTAGLGTVAFLAALSPLLTRRIRELLVHPDRRWWLTPARNPLEVPVVLSDEGRELVAMTFDISESGLFVALDPPNLSDPEQLAPGRVLGLSLDLSHALDLRHVNRMTHVSCLAEIVRLSLGEGRHPRGVGLRFLNLPAEARVAISQMAQLSISGSAA